jgi:hypothetical protein
LLFIAPLREFRFPLSRFLRIACLSAFDLLQ